jgi:hypothetical protein
MGDQPRGSGLVPPLTRAAGLVLAATTTASRSPAHAGGPFEAPENPAGHDLLDATIPYAADGSADFHRAAAGSAPR